MKHFSGVREIIENMQSNDQSTITVEWSQQGKCWFAPLNVDVMDQWPRRQQEGDGLNFILFETYVQF